MVQDVDTVTTTKEALPLNLPPLMRFMAMMVSLKRPKLGESEDGFAYQIIFDKDKPADVQFSDDLVDGINVIDDTVRGSLPAQYTQVVLGITMLIALDFTPLRLLLSESSNFTGVGFSFLTPKGQLFTNRYVREIGEKNFFPDDFLKDLMAFPMRYNQT